MAKRKRNIQILFCVSPEEKKLIRRKMIESKTKNMGAWSERCTGRKSFTLPNAACCTKQTQKYACKINLSLWFGGICIVLSVPVICDWHTSFGNG